MSNNKDFKVKNGIKPTSYQEGVGTATIGSYTSGQYSLANMSSAYSSEATVGNLAGHQSFDTGNSGTVIFAVQNASGDFVYSYTMSTAYDLSTISATGDTINIGSYETACSGLFFKPDGTKFYTVGSGSTKVLQWDMTTAWDLSTASHNTSNYFSVSSQDGVPRDLAFSPDGTKCYVGGGQNQKIFQYTLTTAWDASTGSYDSKFFAVGYNPTTHDITPDGTKMVIGNSANLKEYSLSTAGDVSTAVLSGNTHTYSISPSSGRYSDDGSQYFMFSDGYYANSLSFTLATATLDLSTGSVFDLTPTANTQVSLSNPAASGTVSSSTLLLDGVTTVVGYDLSVAAYDSVSFSVNSQNTNPLDIAFNTDGTKMYIMGNINDTVLQYSLSTGFDLSTASYDSVSFATTSQDTNPRKLSFNNDGTKLYIFGTTTDTVYQYSLSTAWDLSTTSYDSVSFNAASQATNPYGLAFNSDGTKMYLGGGTVFYQYSLSTAFDLSTTSYDSVSFSVSSQDSDAPDLTFNNDGTKMYVVGTSNDNVYQYSLSTAFDLSTASYDSVSFSVGSQDAAPPALAFSNDGTKMYIVGNTNDTIYQYSTGTSTIQSITWDSSIKWSGGTAPDSPSAGETDVYYFSTRDGGTSYIANIAIDGAK
tara:strand:- start:5246 stop:7180 length:1935 start_codon:yes stop_codon:yes gene_type:complete